LSGERTCCKFRDAVRLVRSQGMARSIGRHAPVERDGFMCRITIRSVARLGTGIFSLAVALCLTAPCHAQNLQQIDKNSIAILDSFPSYGGGSTWDATNVLDTTDANTNNQYFTDYASAGGGANTFISFDFGVPYTFSAILFTDRTTSGSGNGAFYGGTFDFCTSYMFTFSNDMTFKTDVGTVVVNVNTPSQQPTSLENFQTLSIISGIPPAQYVKWQVLATNGDNPGAADFAFFGQ
jgi:hypothetical protein